MAKKPEKTRNNKTMTEAQFHSLIVSNLRNASRWWKPKQQCIRKARVSLGKYRCAECNLVVPSTKKGVYKTGKKAGKPKKIKNILADHKDPVVDPNVGFVNWDTFIERLFREDGWQALCEECHSAKTKEERSIGAARRKRESNKI